MTALAANAFADAVRAGDIKSRSTAAGSLSACRRLPGPGRGSVGLFQEIASATAQLMGCSERGGDIADLLAGRREERFGL
jgi:hypothetical protein